MRATTRMPVRLCLGVLACATLLFLAGRLEGSKRSKPAELVDAQSAAADDQEGIDEVRSMKFKPGDAFGKAYELPADRLRAYPGGVSWHRNKGWNFATTESLPAPPNFPGTLARVSKALKTSMNSVGSATEGEDDDAKAFRRGPDSESSKAFSAWRPWSVPGVSDEDYKRDVMRGVLEEHTGFPDLPDCPTEGLWGNYRTGYAPGQKLGAGNCQDYSLRTTGVPASDLAPKLGFNVKTWDSLWKEDLKGLKKARSYAKLTKGLWSDVAPDAAMAYYLPSTYKGSLATYYQEPRGERTATENNAHANSIVPVPSHKGPYYSSDFTRGEALDAPPPVQRVYANRPSTLDANNLAPIVQGLYSGNHLSPNHARASTSSASGVAVAAVPRDMQRGGGGGVRSALSAEEQQVAASLHDLNLRARRRLAMTRGILLKSPSGSTSLADKSRKSSSSHSKLAFSAGALKAADAELKARAASEYTPLSRTTTSALSQAYTGLLYPRPQTQVAVFGQPEDAVSGMESKAEMALKHFHRLRDRLYSYRKYFRDNKFDGKQKLDTGTPPNEANVETADPDVYFWCYSHYGDLSPDKLEGEYPDFEECLHVLGGAKWGPREGGDEALAYGDVESPRPGVENTLKKRRGFGDGFVAASNPDAEDWKYFENEDEEFGGETRNAKVNGLKSEEEEEQAKEEARGGGSAGRGGSCGRGRGAGQGRQCGGGRGGR